MPITITRELGVYSGVCHFDLLTSLAACIWQLKRKVPNRQLYRWSRMVIRKCSLNSKALGNCGEKGKKLQYRIQQEMLIEFKGVGELWREKKKLQCRSQLLVQSWLCTLHTMVTMQQIGFTH